MLSDENTLRTIFRDLGSIKLYLNKLKERMKKDEYDNLTEKLRAKFEANIEMINISFDVFVNFGFFLEEIKRNIGDAFGKTFSDSSDYMMTDFSEFDNSEKIESFENEPLVAFVLHCLDYILTNTTPKITDLDNTVTIYIKRFDFRITFDKKWFDNNIDYVDAAFSPYTVYQFVNYEMIDFPSLIQEYFYNGVLLYTCKGKEVFEDVCYRPLSEFDTNVTFVFMIKRLIYKNEVISKYIESEKIYQYSNTLLLQNLAKIQNDDILEFKKECYKKYSEISDLIWNKFIPLSIYDVHKNYVSSN